MATRTDQPAARDVDPATEAATAALDYAARWAEYQLWRRRVPGAQLAVWFGGRRRLSRSFGVADVRSDDRLTNAHRFRIASHSKTFTATAVLQLAEAGKLGLDDEVGRHVPAVADSVVGTATIRELLSHGGGVSRDSADSDFWLLDRPFPDTAAFAEILRQNLDVTVPSLRFKYSNIGFSMLGMVIEAVGGQPYPDYTDEHIVRPLRLRHTAADLVDGAAYAAPHTGIQTSFDRTVLDNVPTNAMAAATGFTSTAGDLVRYAAAHFTGSGELLTDRSKRWMRQPLWQPDPDDADSGYGLGLASTRVRGRRFYGHGGGWPGHITRTLWEPDIGLAVSVLTNAIDGPADDIARGICEILLTALARTPEPLALHSGHDVTVHGSATREPVAAAGRVDIGRFNGRFANAWSLVDLTPIGDRVYLIEPSTDSPMDSARPLTVIDQRTLRMDAGSGYGAVGELIVLDFDSRGRVRQMRGPNGMTWKPAPRLRPYRQAAE